LKIRIKEYEALLAAAVGSRRRIQSLYAGHKSKGLGEGGFDIDVQAAAAEMAVAKALDIYWDGSVGTFKSKADIGLNIEVRHSIKGPSLIIRPGDQRNSVYIYVEGKLPDYEVKGYMTYEEAEENKEKYWKNPGGKGRVWFVPPSDLHPITDLIND